jgi:hypothetical protein
MAVKEANFQELPFGSTLVRRNNGDTSGGSTRSADLETGSPDNDARQGNQNILAVSGQPYANKHLGKQND